MSPSREKRNQPSPRRIVAARADDEGVVLAVDIGSSSVRSALFRVTGTRILATSASRGYTIRYSADGGSELDPRIVLRAVRSCIAETRQQKNAAPLAVSGSAFWHGLLGVDAKGAPLTPIYTWADNRSAAAAAELREEISERANQLRTGCMLRAPFWPAKLRWLQRRGVTRWLSPAAWIFEKIFNAPGTSHSMASGTGLYHLARGDWDEELCNICGVTPKQLGPIVDRHDDVFTAIGDGAASNLGSGADDAHTIAINIGTSAAARVILPRTCRVAVPRGLFKYVLDRDRVVLGGAISNAGNLRKWCLRELAVRSDVEAERALSRPAAAGDALTVLPFWVEERSPTWPGDLRGTIVGLQQTTTAADLFRGATTGTYYRLAAIVDQLEAALGHSCEIIVSGGVLRSPASLAILADALGRNLRVCPERESSLRGAAGHAWESLGHAPRRLPRGKVIPHRPALAAQHQERRARQEALERAMTR